MGNKHSTFDPRLDLRGRGSLQNHTSRFSANQIKADFSDYGWMDQENETTLLRTEFFKDTSKTILTENKSPDIPFRFSINPYRGCEHGCAYCYARPTHEYLGLSAGLDFESKIYVKENAPELLYKQLMSPKWSPEVISMSGVTDCYQPAERKYQLTRKCLEVLLKFRNPVGIITKNNLVTRDLDLLKELASMDLVMVYLSVTTLDHDLGRVLEPRTSSPEARLSAIEKLSQAGVPVGVNVAPVIPGLTDHEMPAILKAASEHGAMAAGYVPLRLPYSVKDIFTEWLETHRPESKQKVLNYIRSIRQGDLNSSEFGDRMQGSGPYAENIRQMFNVYEKKYFRRTVSSLATHHFQRHGDQLSFF